jgi:hypothetical protein
MTQLLPALASPICQAGAPCDRVPCFQARLEAAAGDRLVRTHAELCTEHLGGTVHALTTWASDRGLRGELTVLAIDRPGASGGHQGPPGDRTGFLFSTIRLPA